VLNIDRGPHIHSGLEELLHVLPALRVARRGLTADRIGMRQLINEQNGRAALQRRIEVELIARDATVAHRERGQPLEALKQPFRLDSAVRLDVADHNVGPTRAGAAGRLEHRIGLAHARGCAEEDA
jgi:hypothetical protein